MKPKYKRILIKISGEALSGGKGHGFDVNALSSVAGQLAELKKLGVEVGVVVGGGNFWRGRSSGTMDRTRADQMGMLATVINCLALQEALIQEGNDAVVMTALDIQRVARPFNKDEAVRLLESGRVVIFGGGTGNPFFSTDSGAALRACEIEADIFFKATNVDGVYDKDPNKFADAVKYDTLTYDEILEKHLGVMDNTAAALAGNSRLPVLVFNLNDPANIKKAVLGENIGTVVK
ncbi:MAG TPA: UMP kinase [Clostridiales bacterium]|nr:UMP kinase [Clostridiales bacterium]